MRRIRRPSPAMVVACLALGVSLSGAAVAASVALPRNSVGPVQLKANAVATVKMRNGAVTTPKLRNNAVTGLKVRNGSLLAADFAAGQLPAGAPGPAGPAGPAGPLLTQLPTGATLKGVFAGRAYTPNAGQDMQIPITFQFPLSAAPTPHYIASGTAPPTQCPGNATAPAAMAGHLCVYESAPAINAVGRVFDPIGGADDTASALGAAVAGRAVAAGDFRVRGSWAVTAP